LKSVNPIYIIIIVLIVSRGVCNAGGGGGGGVCCIGGCGGSKLFDAVEHVGRGERAIAPKGELCPSLLYLTTRRSLSIFSFSFSILLNNQLKIYFILIYSFKLFTFFNFCSKKPLFSIYYGSFCRCIEFAFILVF
jgi:hypothetical protein